MSRFDNEYDGEMWDWVRWQGAKYQAFRSKYGKERLRELEAALLALPNKRLIRGHLIEPYDPPMGWVPLFRWGDEGPSGLQSGDVCAVGAFCAYQMGEGDIKVGLRRLFESRDWNDDDDSETAGAGTNAGMRYVMAWEVGYLNDETLDRLTPEERYDKTLSWVRQRIEHGAEKSSWY